MARRRSDVDGELDALYAQVPPSGCKGLCQHSCGPLEMSDRERRRIRDLGVPMPTAPAALAAWEASGGLWTCPALDPDGRCGVYDARPLICRLWGSVDHPQMRCPHGCAPDEPLTHARAGELIEASLAIGGG